MKKIIFVTLMFVTSLFSNNSEYKQIFNIGKQIAEDISPEIVYSLIVNDSNLKYKTTTKNDFLTIKKNKWPIVDVKINALSKVAGNKTITFSLIIEIYKSSYVVATVKNIKVNKKVVKKLNHINNTKFIYDDSGTQEVKFVNGDIEYVNMGDREEDPSDTPNVILVSDFILDYNSLKHSNICVKGSIFAMGDIITLSDLDNQMTQVFLDINNLSRELRKKIITICNGSNNCIQTICGIAQDINFDKGIKVNEIK